MVGDKGTGKSYWALATAMWTAAYIAGILQKGTWSDYFTIDNVAVIDRARILELAGNAKPYNVYVFDDVGVGWDARDFGKETNKFLNHVFEICRIRRNVLIITVPQQFMIDKVPRNTSLYNGVMKERLFDYDPPMSVAAMYKRHFELHANKMLNPYVAMGKMKLTRIVTQRPAYSLTEEYDRVREMMSATEFAKMDSGDEVKKARDAEKVAQERAKTEKMMMVDHEVKVNGASVRGTCRKFKMSMEAYRHWRDKMDRLV